MVQIRRGTLADISQIQALEMQSDTAAHWSTGQYNALFAEDCPKRIVLVAENGDNDRRVVGFLITRCLPDEWEIENLVVAGDQKRRGIGTALVRHFLSESRMAGALSVILEVRESNAPARLFYESNGFKPEGRRKSYYAEPREDAILYRRSLLFCDKIP